MYDIMVRNGFVVTEESVSKNNKKYEKLEMLILKK